MVCSFIRNIQKKKTQFENKYPELTDRLSMIFIVTAVFLSITAVLLAMSMKQHFWMYFPSVMIFIGSTYTLFRSKNLKRSVTFWVIVITFIYLPFLYFTNGGNNGISCLLFVMIVIYQSFYLKGKTIMIVFPLTMILFTLLSTIGYFYPEYVIGYDSELGKFLGNVVVVNAVFIVVCIVGTSSFYGYRNEHKKAIKLTEALEIQNQKLLELSIVDQLTSVFNRRRFIEALDAELIHFKECSKYFHVLMIDIDDFKVINDTNGHLFGDEVLRKVAKEIVKSTRDYDLIARYGGEEFSVIISHLNEVDAKVIAERIRDNISKLKFRNDTRVTISIGATKSRKDDTMETVIHRADTNLYKAKDLGKNQVISD